MNSKEMNDYLKEHYGIDFPMKAKYKRDKNRLYFVNDFEDGEEIEFYYLTNKPNASSKGYAWYRSVNNPSKTMLININRGELNV